MNDASAGLPVQDMEPQTVIAFENDHVPHGTSPQKSVAAYPGAVLRIVIRSPYSFFQQPQIRSSATSDCNSRMVCFSDSISSWRPAQPFVSLGEFFFGYEHDFRFLG